jgi:23S rRNA (adenine2503-C2)-methyltransferase
MHASLTATRFVVIEYVMLRGVNDTAGDAQRLAEMLSGIYCMVNLIVFNPHEGTQFERSSDEDVRHFRSTLAKSGKVRATASHKKP